MSFYRLLKNGVNDTLNFIGSLVFVWLFGLIIIIYGIINYVRKEKNSKNKQQFIKTLIFGGVFIIFLTFIISYMY